MVSNLKNVTFKISALRNKLSFSLLSDITGKEELVLSVLKHNNDRRIVGAGSTRAVVNYGKLKLLIGKYSANRRGNVFKTLFRYV